MNLIGEIGLVTACTLLSCLCVLLWVDRNEIKKQLAYMRAEKEKSYIKDILVLDPRHPRHPSPVGPRVIRNIVFDPPIEMDVGVKMDWKMEFKGMEDQEGVCQSHATH